MKIESVIIATSIVFITGCTKEPTACFDVDKSEIETGETISFSDCSSDAKSYEWDFGDGNISNETSPSHIYETSGTYNVKLKTFSKRERKMDSQSKEIKVRSAFKNQDLQGKIDGVNWNYTTGNVDYNSYGPYYSFEIVNYDNIEDTCWLFVNQPDSYYKVIFSLTPEEFKVGNVVEFTDIWSTDSDENNTQTITYVFETPSMEYPMNNIVTNGKLEITKIDTASGIKIVEGKLAGDFDESNYLNGNFKLKYCD